MDQEKGQDWQVESHTVPVSYHNTGFTAGMYKNEDIIQALELFRDRDEGTLVQDVLNEVGEVGTPSPFVSTTLCLPYALWKAERLQRGQPNDRVRIAVIRTAAVSRDSFIALKLLPRSVRPHDEDWERCYNYANSFQEVLVPIQIGPSSIVGSILWEGVQDMMLPRWFLTGDPDSEPLSRTNYGGYRIQRFFEDVRRRFDSEAVSCDDAKSDARRLAFFLVDSWLSECLNSTANKEEFMSQTAETVTALAYDIVRWPSLEFKGRYSVDCTARSWSLPAIESSLTDEVISHLTIRWNEFRTLALRKELRDFVDRGRSILQELNDLGDDTGDLGDQLNQLNI
ncbi:hypothetical protein BD410DRAFT_310890 [Rickenella mellea]|uniref:DUF7587 domain-containing protein n=1 Tax=Rickenella mellea TaxID=50990 RepID=A0A4Y7Q1R5_9AGAM|nr:hypothetical protein BD410DRAFT_310890 [Rickenella mellea]